ncbi:diacylglycerol kinase family protein [Saccharibacillus sp. CPCC 101409]|uniref:diacylglycerol kinase family protein n=1 Tax=Saccharibacillus sp. CPCC 101409 TaxID=3058041 RepID=UPI0026721554|nr:diacylglycerol kinase family protein [Saccharibacillus sp. CPCC 101409]MDO3409173.1 diacylglycerol kinase family protein [Saccharibacillus sp. CPCC 101409]
MDKRRTWLDVFRNAWDGVRATASTERNFKVHLALSAAVFALGGLLRVPRLDWALLCLAMGLVLSAELMNTAVEAAVNLTVGERIHPLAKKAKDAAAGAVLASAVFAAVIGLLVFGPPLLGLARNWGWL